jgi:glyoxylase-like metal-dependent hydrolase (beta-lactamase superfamily II)
LLDGGYDYPIENFFANAAGDDVRAALQARGLPADHITTPYTHLFVDTDDHKILVDMGAGHLTPDTGNLVANLRSVGIEPSDIDTVILTHAHPDHIGGALDRQGNPIYKDACYYVSRTEWDFWFSDETLAQADDEGKMFIQVAQNALTTLEAQTYCIDFSDHVSEIYPGVEALAAPGHTPGHIVLRIRSGNDVLYDIGDTVLSALHLEHPDWRPVYDAMPEEADATKHRVLDESATEQAWVMGQHLAPFPSLGHVEKTAAGWVWKPVR